MDNNELTIDEIAERTGLSARGLRYVLDHNILDEVIPWFGLLTAKRRGVPRRFPRYFAFLLAVAATLRLANLDREQVGRALDLLAGWVRDYTRGRDYAQRLVPLLSGADEVEIHIADARALRARRSPTAEAHADVPIPAQELPWTDLRSRTPDPAPHRPVLVTRLDVGEVRRRLGNEKA